jgi:hypothetical protein
MLQDIKKHKNVCLRCQQGKKSTNKKTLLAPLPNPKWPNLRIHADLFSPMITAGSHKEFLLCITDVITKYAFVTAIANKDAETVADSIYKECFLKFRILAQIRTRQWKRISKQTFSFSMSATQELHHAMLKLRFLTKQ